VHFDCLRALLLSYFLVDTFTKQLLGSIMLCYILKMIRLLISLVLVIMPLICQGARISDRFAVRISSDQEQIDGGVLYSSCCTTLTTFQKMIYAIFDSSTYSFDDFTNEVQLSLTAFANNLGLTDDGTGFVNNSMKLFMGVPDSATGTVTVHCEIVSSSPVSGAFLNQLNGVNLVITLMYQLDESVDNANISQRLNSYITAYTSSLLDEEFIFSKKQYIDNSCPR
jgi:hypothetical protein